MMFSNKKRRHYDLNIMTDLRVIIDNKLTWKDHVAHVASKNVKRDENDHKS